MVFDVLRYAEQDAAALPGRYRGPAVRIEGAPRRRDRPLDVPGVASRDPGDHVARGRVRHLVRLARGRVRERAVDVVSEGQHPASVAPPARRALRRRRLPGMSVYGETLTRRRPDCQLRGARSGGTSALTCLRVDTIIA